MKYKIETNKKGEKEYVSVPNVTNLFQLQTLKR